MARGPACWQSRRVDLDIPVEEAAAALVGRVLVHVKGGRTTAGRIVEVEAYGGQGEDACSHAHRRRTGRNGVMFGPPGRLYVYFTYGMHHCVNVVAHPRGRAGAVLLRALEPVEGLALMRRRRRLDDHRLLCSGPARLAVAMGLGSPDNGRRLGTGRLHLLDDGSVPELGVTPRIGVNGPDADRPWRFVAAGSPWASRRP